jgi:hypothetical protein
MRRHRRTSVQGLLLAGLMSAALATAAPAQDLRSPDARDAATPLATAPADLRSPDARDAATPLAVAELPAISDSVGFDVSSAAIGTGIGLLLALLGLGAATAIGRRAPAS